MTTEEITIMIYVVGSILVLLCALRVVAIRSNQRASIYANNSRLAMRAKANVYIIRNS